MPSRKTIAGWTAPEDFRQAARRRLPKLFFDYLDGAAGAERTAADNIGDFDKIRFLPSVLQPARPATLQTDFLGARHSLPLMLGPIGSLGMFRAQAELMAFRVAKRRGLQACLSSFTITPPERLSSELPAGAAFQLYVLKDFGRTRAMLERMRAAGFSTLVVTVDVPVSGIRERDIRNGLRQRKRLSPAQRLALAARPGWLLNMARAYPARMALAEDWPEAGRRYLSQAAFLARQIDPELSWQTISRLRALWPGWFVLKGIQRADDLGRAIESGVDGVILSNHGGRQLDGCPSTISTLARMPAPPTGFDLILDGGVRRGTDVVKAIALGATACALGRAYAYALAAGGEAGLERLLDGFAAEISASLALLGVDSLDALRREGRSLVDIRC